eukprot:1645097-Prymnesium_polylepis.1
MRSCWWPWSTCSASVSVCSALSKSPASMRSCAARSSFAARCAAADIARCNTSPGTMVWPMADVVADGRCCRQR